MPRTELQVNLAQFKSNLIAIKKSCGSSVGIMTVIKANAYGHGAVAIAKASVAAGATYLAVASLDEAKILRRADISTPILLLSEHSPDIFLDSVAVTIFSPSQVSVLIKKARLVKQPIKVHIKVDTGMHRLGLLAEEVPAVLDELKTCQFIQVEGVFTHLSCSKSDSDSQSQFEQFYSILKACNKNNHSFRYTHMTNSIGTENFPNMHFNMVRIGFAAYRHVMTVHTRVISIKALKKGDKVGYEHDYCLDKDAHIAVLEMGYADGFPDKYVYAKVMIKGVNYPVVGLVCMDMISVDLGSLASGVMIGDVAVFSPTQLSDDSDLNLRTITCSFDRPRTKLTLMDGCYT